MTTRTASSAPEIDGKRLRLLLTPIQSSIMMVQQP